MTKREYIVSIRREYIGLSDSPRKSLLNSIRALANDLYAKDTHFIFELIQNAEDNDYEPSKQASLRFEVDWQALDGESEPVLIMHNNETGFLDEHVKALCMVGESTKKKAQDYIGEKGIGFKSVFRVTQCPYIFSNGFQFRLPEHDEETGLGYIVPAWVEREPAGINPTETTIILPLDKSQNAVQDVVAALRDIAPETILFLKKLTSIEVSVRLPEQKYDVLVEKRVQAAVGESRLVQLTYLKSSASSQERFESLEYWLTKVEYTKPDHIQSEKRSGIGSRPVSVAVPVGATKRSDKLFAYLPVWEDTGLPFIINADFLLVSSREGLHEDEPWNKWLRDCVIETYVQAFMALLTRLDFSFEERVSAYGAIPLSSSKPFLRPIICAIQDRLADQECVLVLPEGALVAPSEARFCDKDFRVILDSADRLPHFLREEVWLVRPELECFAKQLETIGVTQLEPAEIVACLQDTAWVQEHDLGWFLALFRYLKSLKIEPVDLRNLAIIPIAHDGQEGLRLSSCQEQPVYFERSEADQPILAGGPDWLSEFVPIAFLEKDLLGLLTGQEDWAALKKWLTDLLNVQTFSMKSYCERVLTQLTQDHADLKDDQLVEATKFLAKLGGKGLPWQDLPVIFSDGQRMLLREARKQSKDIVVPDGFDPEAGWQHIWVTPQDREHFWVLANDYQKFSADWFDALKIKRYPYFRTILYTSKLKAMNGSPEDVLFKKCEKPATKTEKHRTIVKSWVRPSSLTQHGTEAQTSRSLSQSLLGFLLEVPENKSWPDEELYRLGFKAQGGYYHHGWKTSYADSSILQSLRELPWLLSTRGYIVPPSQAFISSPGIKEIFGDTVSYVEEDVLPESTLRLLGVRFDMTVDELLSLLRECSARSDANPELVERIYTQLNARTRYPYDDDIRIKAKFSTEALILVRDSQQRIGWRKSGECVWEDASAVFGDDLAYLAGLYPQLEGFFVGCLGVKRCADEQSFADRWLKFQVAPIADIQRRREIMEKLYRAIKPIASTWSKPPWWQRFSTSAKLYTQTDTFEFPTMLVVPDDGEWRDIFEGVVPYAWQPAKDAFGDWSDFYQAFGVPLLSKSVTEHLEDEVASETQPSNRFVTEATIKLIAAWLREKPKPNYRTLQEQGVFAQLVSLRETRVPSPVSVSFRLSTTALKVSKTVPYSTFWDRTRNILIYCDDSEKSQLAKAIARGLLPNQTDKDLAHWIELVLGSSTTDRLRHDGWSVPQEISALFVHGATASAAPESATLPGELEPITLPPAVVTPATGTPFHDVPPQRSGGSQPSAISEEDVAKPSRPRPEASSGDQHATKAPRPPQAAPGSRPEVDTGANQSDHIQRLDLVSEIRAAFHRPGPTEFDRDMESDTDEGYIVKNPQRRSERLETAYKEGLDSEPTPEERRRHTERTLLEGPNEAVRVSLQEWYGGKCQICGETWPKRDGHPFFAAAYLVERQHARWLDDPGIAICLCAEHFAQWRHAAKEMPLDVFEQIRSLALHAEGGKGDLSIDFTLLGKDVAIVYDERHFLALRTLVEVASQELE